MTRIESFVSELAKLDVRLWVDDGRLRCSAPSGVLTPELQSRLAECKADLLAFLEEARPARPTEDLVPVPRDDALPLSLGQERILSLAELRPDSDAYNTSTIHRLSGPLDVAALERSLDEIQRRHEILRTTFPSDGSGPRQRISATPSRILAVTDLVRDLGRLPTERREPEIRRLLRAELKRPFDLETGPLWRTLLLRLGEEEHILCVSVHHSIFDGGSDAVFLAELGLFYNALVAGETPRPVELPIQYVDFACWQRRLLEGDGGTRQLDYWRRRLDGAVRALRLPTDRPRAAATTRDGRSMDFALPDPLTGKLAALGRREQTGLFATLLTGYCALLHRYTGQRDQIVCSPFAARDRAELEGLIGYFNNIVALRVDLGGDPALGELLGRVRRTALEASEHQSLPFQRVAELPNLIRTPLTRGMFCFQDFSNRELDLTGITATPIDLRKETADFELALYVQSAGDGTLFGVLEYDAGLFDEQTISRLLEDWRVVLECIATDPERRLSELPRLGFGRADVASRLTADPHIDEAMVVERNDDRGSVAYLVLNEHDTPDLDAIRRSIRAAVPDYLVPETFVPLDRLPLDADGNVDADALPLPAAPGPRVEAFVAPRTATEERLAGIWKKALWLDRDVGVEDHFTDLGGHSLLSVQLVAELERELERELPVRALSRLSTVAEMARILDEEERTPAPAPAATTPVELPQETYRALLTYTGSWSGRRVTPESLIVGLNTDGARRPLFWCLQRYAELNQLARYIGDDQPVYGMRSGNRVMVKTQQNIDALAAHYVGELLAVQPEGPFLLGGNCQAAQISLALAGALRALGHEVSLLIMLEKFVPQPYAGRIAMLFGAESNRNPYLHYREPEIGWNKYYAGPWTVELVSGQHARFFQEPNVQVLAEAVRRKIDEAERGDPAMSDHRREASGLQRLPQEAYRARLAARPSWTVEPGQSLSIPVEVVNASSVIWRSGERSGIALANRWVDANEKVVEAPDGRVRLPHDLEPGSAVELELTVTAPEGKGRWSLELDLVEEGVTWFQRQGSTLTRLAVDVRRRSVMRAGYRALRRLLPQGEKST